MSRSRFTVHLDQHGEICAELEGVGAFPLSVDEARRLSKDAHTAAERHWRLRYEAILDSTTIEQVIAKYSKPAANGDPGARTVTELGSAISLARSPSAGAPAQTSSSTLDR
jgi:hypothetical protein